MKFSARFTKQDLKDRARLLHPTFYWSRMLLSNVQELAIAVALLWIAAIGAFEVFAYGTAVRIRRD